MKEAEILKSYCQVLSDALLEVSRNGPKSYKVLKISLADLGDIASEELCNAEDYSRLVETFSSLTDPCIYWFEISQQTNIENVWNSFRAYKNKHSRSVPAMKKELPKNTNILYLGKVKKGLLGRLKQHLGFTNAIKTQSLQLRHWASEIGLVVKIHVMEFEQENSNLVGVFEFKLAREMKTILGTHTT